MESLARTVLLHLTLVFPVDLPTALATVFRYLLVHTLAPTVAHLTPHTLQLPHLPTEVPVNLTDLILT